MTYKTRLFALMLIAAILSITASVSAQATPTSTPVPNPNANITWPPPVYVVKGLFTIYGSANLPDMSGWFLEERLDDSTLPEDQGWTPVTLSLRTPVQNTILGVWDTTVADDGIYSLRLNVSLSNGSRVYALVTPLRIENNPPPFAGLATPQPGVLPTLSSGGLPTLIPTPTAFSTTPQATARLNANVRRGDGTMYETIGNLPAGTTVQIVGISSLGTGWYLIVMPNGVQGWVAPSVVDVTGNFSGVPRVNPPPPPAPTPVPVTATPNSTINLVAGNFRFVPGSPNCGQTFNIYIDVANFGSQFSPSGTINISDFRQADGSFQTSTVGAFPPIAPGQTLNIGPIPLTVSTYYNENHRLEMTVDGSNLIFESNENDNNKEAIYLLNKAGCP